MSIRNHVRIGSSDLGRTRRTTQWDTWCTVAGGQAGIFNRTHAWIRTLPMPLVHWLCTRNSIRKHGRARFPKAAGAIVSTASNLRRIRRHGKKPASGIWTLCTRYLETAAYLSCFFSTNLRNFYT